MSEPITPHDFPAIRWHGQWVWVPEEPVRPSGFWQADPRPPRERHGLFRRSFWLDAPPQRVPARISADARYALWVNGHELARGPIRSQPRRLHYDMADLAPLLRQGENVVAIYVKHYGQATSFWMPATPNNTLGGTGALVFEADLGAAGWLASDSTWKAQLASAWGEGGRDGTDHGGGVPVEVFDARLLAHGWRGLGFDDGGWGQAQPIPAMHVGGFARAQPPADPYGALLPRPFGQLGGQLRQPATATVAVGPQPEQAGGPIAQIQAALALDFGAAQAAELPLELELAHGRAALVVIDMGRVVSGLVGFALDAPAGTTLDLSYAEEPLSASISMDKMRAGTRYTARGHDDEFELFDSNGFRYAYALIGGGGRVALRGFGMRELLYPWQGEASFACDDEELNRIYRAGLRTVQICSHDALIDCPTREQRAWVGDAVVQQMVHLATNADWRLAWHYLALADSPRPDGLLPMTVVGDIEASGMYSIPSWSLHWLHGLHALMRFGGDREAAQARMPTAERVLRWFLPFQDASGVLRDVTEWGLIDWASISTEDASAALTALWARGLREFAELAGWLGDHGRRRWAEQTYGRVREGFEQFWDARRGCYCDHMLGAALQPAVSQLPGALAIVAGLAPQERWGQIVAAITDPARLAVRSWMGNGAGEQSMERWQAQVERGEYTITWDVEREIVLAEPFMSYVVHDAVALAGQADRLPAMYRRWSQFLAGGYDTLGECWDFGTHAHGWSSTPTRDMVFYTLGITPAKPGYAHARVAPRLGGLAWARGSAPTPHGPIHVAVDRERVAVDSPVPFTLDLPGQPPLELPAGQHERTY